MKLQVFIRFAGPMCKSNNDRPIAHDEDSLTIHSDDHCGEDSKSDEQHRPTNQETTDPAATQARTYGSRTSSRL